MHDRIMIYPGDWVVILNNCDRSIIIENNKQRMSKVGDVVQIVNTNAQFYSGKLLSYNCGSRVQYLNYKNVLKINERS